MGVMQEKMNETSGVSSARCVQRTHHAGRFLPEKLQAAELTMTRSSSSVALLFRVVAQPLSFNVIVIGPSRVL